MTYVTALYNVTVTPRGLTLQLVTLFTFAGFSSSLKELVFTVSLRTQCSAEVSASRL